MFDHCFIMWSKSMLCHCTHVFMFECVYWYKTHSYCYLWNSNDYIALNANPIYVTWTQPAVYICPPSVWSCPVVMLESVIWYTEIVFLLITWINNLFAFLRLPGRAFLFLSFWIWNPLESPNFKYFRGTASCPHAPWLIAEMHGQASQITTPLGISGV